MKRVTFLVAVGLLVATTAFAQSSEKDILETKNACRERVQSVDKGAVLKWHYDQTDSKFGRPKEDSLQARMRQSEIEQTDVMSHWSLKLHTCLAIVETQLDKPEDLKVGDKRSWRSLVLDVTELRPVAIFISVWLDGQNTIGGKVLWPSSRSLTLDEYRKLISE